MVAEINTARKANESLGGVFEVRAFGLVPGIGSHISWEERLDGRLAGAIMSIQAMKGVGIGDGFDLAGRVGSQGARRDLLVGGARLLPRDQPRRRHRGRHDQRRPGGGPRRDEAAADADQAAAQRRHRHQGAGGGAARADRLLHGAGGRRGGRGDGRAGAGRRLPREARAATTSTTPRQRCAPTRSASGGVARSHRRRDRPGRVHGRGQVDRRPLAGRRARRARPSTPTASWSSGSASRSSRSSTARARRRSARARRRSSASCSTATTRRVIALGGGALQSERVREALDPPHGRAPGDRARGRLAARVRARAGRWRATRRASRRSGATGAALYESVADVVVPPSRPRRPAPRAAVRRARWPRRRPGRGWSGPRRSRATTRSSSAAA